MQLPMTMELRPSVSLAAVLLLGHGLALVGVLPCNLPLIAKGLLILLLVLSCTHGVVRHAWHRNCPGALTLRRDGRMELVWSDGRAFELDVDSRTMVHPWLIVLRLRSGRWMENLVLSSDVLGADNHRKLRVWLRWKVENRQA